MHLQTVNRAMTFILLVVLAMQTHSVFADSTQQADWTTHDRQANLLKFTYSLYSPDNPDDLVGYAYEISSDANLTRLTGDIIFVPGFDVTNATALIPDAGSAASYYRRLNQLKTEYFQPRLGPDAGMSNSFIEYLVSELGYRVWLIDFVDSGARVQRNSLAVQALLADPVYRLRAGQTDNHIFGYSMGGLVSRHALLKIQQKAINPDLTTFVSLDAPHRGAFLPPAIEVVTRTIPRMADGGSAEFALTHIEQTFDRFLKPFDSDAAKQLLGVYIGSGVPSVHSGYFSHRSYTAKYRAYQELFSSIESDHVVAPHPAYYELRQELIAMGGYPSSTVNIGVSFGSEDSSERRSPSTQSEQPLAWELGQSSFTILRAQYHSSNSSMLCQIDAIGRRSRDCPPLVFSGGHLEGIFQAPGSSTSVYTLIANAISDNPSFDPTIRLADDASPMTFVPTASAFDDGDWAYTYLNAGGQEIDTLDTPFDVVMANRSGYGSDHSFIHHELVTRINRTITQTTLSPGSSFFNARGGFDGLRYSRRQSPRALPIHNQQRKTDRPLGRNQIAALVATF